jgi:hypothetical protein
VASARSLVEENSHEPAVDRVALAVRERQLATRIAGVRSLRISTHTRTVMSLAFRAIMAVEEEVT